MSSTYLTSNDMAMIASLLAEVREAGPQRRVDVESAQARLLVHAFERGITGEADLRSLLAGHASLQGILSRSHDRWANGADAPLHRQEHILPSPEEEFNAAGSINPMADAPRSGRDFIAQNADGETANVHWLPGDVPSGLPAHWVRSDTGESFNAVHWVQTTWTAAEVLKYSGAGP